MGPQWQARFSEDDVFSREKERRVVLPPLRRLARGLGREGTLVLWQVFFPPLSGFPLLSLRIKH